MLNKKAETVLAISALLLMVLGIFAVTQTGENSITGYYVANQLCYNNENSCIDLDGDGYITLEDEDIFAQLLTDPSYLTSHPGQKEMSDFDGDGDVDQGDFQQCFVPLRDYYIDQKNREVQCNRPADPITERDNHTGCTNGCADLNGDGFVDGSDHALLTGEAWGKKVDETDYPMADLDGDGEIGQDDKFCFTAYKDKVVMCNLETSALHKRGCPDLTDEFDTGNDGIVDSYDQDLFDQYKSEQNPKADFNDDGVVNGIDEYVFDQYIGKIIDCNIYHAPWHIGGIDQNNSDISYTSSNSIGGAGEHSISFTTGRGGQLTKIRFYMEYISGDNEEIDVKLHPEGNSGMNTSALIAETKIQGFSNNESHWETAYFIAPPVLDNNTKYYIHISSQNSSSGAYRWFVNSDGPIFEQYSSTACADLNGDGNVDSEDEDIISQIPDGMTEEGVGEWNESYDFNKDFVIDEDDADFINDAITGGEIRKPEIVLDNDAGSGSDNLGNIFYKAQSFNATNTRMSKAEVNLASNSDQKQKINVEIYDSQFDSSRNISVPDSKLASASIEGFTGSGWHNASFNPTVSLSLGETYFIVVYSPNSTTSDAYEWSKGNSFAGGYSYESINSGTEWDRINDTDYAFRTYTGDAAWNESYDLDNNEVIDTEDLVVINSVIPSYNGIFWTPLVDFNAVFGEYEELRDKTLGFDVYKGKILKCGLPEYTKSQDNGRCEHEIGENYSNSEDCVECDGDGFCDIDENFMDCEDCKVLRGFPDFSKFDGETTNFGYVPDIENVEDAVLEIEDHGKITFLEPVNFSGLDLDNNVFIENNNVTVNIDDVPELNVSAKVSLYNITYVHPRVLKDGKLCKGCSITQYSGDVLKFETEGFSTYTSEEYAPDTEGFNGSTTDFSYGEVSEIENVSSAVLEKEGKGKITFSWINASKANYTKDVEISLNGDAGGWVFVDTSEDSRMNQDAEITLYGLGLHVPKIILEDGSGCPSDVCENIDYPENCEGSCDISFDVSKFSPGFRKYQVIENNTEPQFVNGPISTLIFEEGDSAEVDLEHHFFDADDPALNYSYDIKSGTGVSVNLDEGVATLDSASGWYGLGWIVFNASDGDANHSEATTGIVQFIVTSNLPPELYEEIQNKEIDEDSSLNMSLYDHFEDPNGDNLSFDYGFVDENTKVTVNIEEDTASIVPEENWHGERFIYFRASDGQYDIESNVFELDIESVNDIPENYLDIPDMIINEDENKTVHLPDHFRDIEDTELEYSFTENANFNITVSGQDAIFVPEPDWHGSSKFRIIAEDDDGGEMESNEFGIYVVSVPDPVTWNGSNVNFTWMEDENYTANLSDYFHDPEEASVYNAVQNISSSNLSIRMDHLSGEATIVPDGNWTGVEYVNFTAQDATPASAWGLIKMKVINVDDPPYAKTIPNQTWGEDNVLMINLSEYFIDIDGDDLNYTANGSLRVNVTIDNSTDTASLVPEGNWSGIDSVTFTGYSNETVIESNLVMLNVTPVNDAPFFIPGLENKTAIINERFVYDTNAFDLEYDNISYHDNATQFNISQSGKIAWNTTMLGRFVFNITVCDDSMAANNCSSEVFSVEVADPNEIIDSEINGTDYTGYNRLSNVSGIYASVINISNVEGPVIDVRNSEIFNSTISNSGIDNCIILDSVLENMSCSDAEIDPSTVINSDTTGSVVIDSYIKDSDATYSRVMETELIDVDMNNSNISCENGIHNTKVRDADIVDCTAYSGTIEYPDGTEYDASVNGPKNIRDIANYNPEAGFSYSKNKLDVQFTDESTDANLGGELNDSLEYNWTFGDGDASSSKDPDHSYSNKGDYDVRLEVQDRFGRKDIQEKTVSVSSGSGNGGGGSGGGGSGGGSGGCTSKWQCTEWSECINGMQKRNCTDINGCGKIEKKPEEMQTCGCFEDWHCEEWGDCIAGTQTRECIDWKGCGTEKNKPDTSRECEMPAAETCYDGVINQDEKGVDCGGVCAPCIKEEPKKEEPAKKSNWLLYVVLLAIILGCAGAGIAAYEIVHPKRIRKHEISKDMHKIKEESIDTLVSYIEANMKRGYAKKKIRNALNKEGWPKALVDEAFEKVKFIKEK